MLSRFSGVWLFATPWNIAHQAPLSIGFSRQEYWSELPCPSPGDLPDLGIEPTSLMTREDSLPAEPLWLGRSATDSWVGKILWRRNQLPTLVFLPGGSHGQKTDRLQSMDGVAKSWTEQLSLSFLCLLHWETQINLSSHQIAKSNGISCLFPILLKGFPRGASGKESTCQCRRGKRCGKSHG